MEPIDCEHDWHGKIHEVKKYGSSIFVHICLECSSGKMFLDNIFFLTPEGAKKFLTTWKPLNNDDFIKVK